MKTLGGSTIDASTVPVKRKRKLAHNREGEMSSRCVFNSVSFPSKDQYFYLFLVFCLLFSVAADMYEVILMRYFVRATNV